jgi:hypothetical protein
MLLVPVVSIDGLSSWPPVVQPRLAMAPATASPNPTNFANDCFIAITLQTDS